MMPEEVLALLVELARRTGIRVRFDELVDPFSNGGLCKVGGAPLIVLDARSPVAAQTAMLANALARSGVWALYVPRAAREPSVAKARVMKTEAGKPTKRGDTAKKP